ncbi:MAG: serine hydrolase [Gammaproteobacteria bacterium]
MTVRLTLLGVFAGLLLACLPVLADSIDDYPQLQEATDPALQRQLEQGLERLGLAPAVRQARLAVALVDITDLGHPRVAAVNGDHMMYAASLPKVGILLAALHEIEEGRMRYSMGLRRSLVEMIRVSSNVEATRVMNLVGKRRVNEILASPRFALYDPAANGGIWVGKEYGKRPAFQRDPLHNISHGATAMQVARLYYLLETGQLLSPAMSAAMKDALSHPAIDHKFVKGLAGRKVDIFRKSGTWRQWHADSAIVESERGRYIIVGLAESGKGGKWLERIAGSMHDTLYPRQLARR